MVVAPTLQQPSNGPCDDKRGVGRGRIQVAEQKTVICVQSDRPPEANSCALHKCRRVTEAFKKVINRSANFL